MRDEGWLKVADVAERMRLSPHTIYRNPSRYGMFKVGGAWRATEESLEKISHQTNNAIRLAVVGGGKKSCRSTKGVQTTGWTSQRQTAAELEGLLARGRKSKRRSITTS